VPGPDTPSVEDQWPATGVAVGQGVGAFVGREREMELLLAGLRDAVSGRGRLVLIGGEPGIGKTRLADEFSVLAAGDGASVLWGRCWEAGGAPAYWPWTQSIRSLLRHLDADALAGYVGDGGAHLTQVLPELRLQMPGLPEPPAASSETARFQLFDAVSGFLDRAARDRPLVLILEDLHAADVPSLLLLRFAAVEVGASRIFVLGTYRDVEVTRDHALAAALPELARTPGTTRITLSGLSGSDVARFIATIAGRDPPPELVTAVHRETEGNPLFVEEVVRLLAAEGRLADPGTIQLHRWRIPEGVREVIGRRLARLPESCRKILSLASVVGRDFSLEVLERISGTASTSLLSVLRDAVDARLVEEVQDDPGRLRFSHALVRDTLYEDLQTAERIALHGDVGQVLEELYRSDPEPHLAELAYHFFEAAPAGDVKKAVDHLIAAGQRALRLLAYEEAVRVLGMALRAMRESPDEQLRCEVLLLLGDAQWRSGDTPESKETFLEAASIATRSDLSEHLARAALGYAGRFPWQRAGTDRQVIPLLRQALAALGPVDAPLRVRVQGRLAGLLRDQPSLEARATLAADAVAMARRIGDPETLTYALLARWAASLLGPDGLEESLATAEELDRLAEQVGDRDLLTNTEWIRFIAFMTAGDAWSARSQFELYGRLSEELKQPSQRWYVGIMETILALQEGRFEEVEALIDEAYRRGRHRHPVDADVSRLLALFMLRREQGRLTEVEEELRRAPAELPGYRSLRCMLLVLLCDSGRTDEARILFDQLAADRFMAFPKDNEWLFALTLLAEAAVALEDRDRAAVLYELLTPYEGLVGLAASEVSVGPVARPLGILAGLLGERDAAARHLTTAIDRSQRMGARPWVAHAEHAYAALLAQSDEPAEREQAFELLTSAAAICEDIGMPRLGGQIAALLASLGARPRRRGARAATPPGAPKGTVLTEREREVVELIVEGLSNRQIAERLYLSERTAETHVQNILVKLGFNSRTQIAAWALRDPDHVDGT
jgi:eukaryotic-like serine/threonine-protein kinase